MSSSKPIRVLEVQTKECLFSCDHEELERAYEFAKQMEELGIDVEIESPSAAQSLATSLGASTEELARELEEEIASHDCDGCSTTPLQ